MSTSDHQQSLKYIMHSPLINKNRKECQSRSPLSGSYYNNNNTHNDNHVSEATNRKRMSHSACVFNNCTSTSTSTGHKVSVMKTLASLLLIATLSVCDTSQQSTNQQFDASNHKDVYSAIKEHPRLREFAKLLELDGVKPLVANDQAELTIFAPVDDAMEDLIQKAKSRSFNLADVAKHHIVSEAVIADDNSRYPISVLSQTRSSPLFLSQPQYQEEGLFKYHPQQGIVGRQPVAPIFVNNAKIVETYVFQNGDSVLQVLHVIDHILERLSITQRASIRTQNVQSEPTASATSTQTGAYNSQQAASALTSAQSRQHQSSSGNNHQDINLDYNLSQEHLSHQQQQHQQQQHQARSLKQTPHTAAKWKTEYKQAQIRIPVTLDNVLTNQQVLYDFYEKYSDLTSPSSASSLASDNTMNKLHIRTYTDAQLSSDYRLDRDEFDLERLVRALRAHPQLFGLLYNTTEGANKTSQFNTYFLPMPTHSKLFDNEFAKNVDIIKAHVIPNKVLFTRTMGLGRAHASLGRVNDEQVTLNLAKTVYLPPHGPQQRPAASLLGMPLLLQSNFEWSTPDLAPKSSSSMGSGADSQPPVGIVSSEIVVANIPLTSGVLHLIRKPVIVSDVPVIDYINDQDHQLSHLLGASGTLTRGVAPNNLLVMPGPISTGVIGALAGVASASKFRELMMKNHQLYDELSASSLKTILVPSDEAFDSMRYDLRALINQDEQLVPKSWDEDRRNEIVLSLLKKHIIMHKRIVTSDKLPLLATSNSDDHHHSPVAHYNLNGQQVDFYRDHHQSQQTMADDDSGCCGQFVVTCDATRANILHRNLAGFNGVVHVIDRVLGEEPETVYSLLKSIVLKQAAPSPGGGGEQQATLVASDITRDIGQLIEANISNKQRLMMAPSALAQQQQVQQLGGRISKEQFVTSAAGASKPLLDEPSNTLEQQPQPQQQQQQQPPEVDEPKLFVIADTIKQYLEAPQNLRQLEVLAKSVNISYQLAKSSRDASDDWNERFKQQDKMFTYFVPSDLAWLKLQQRQPRLHEPLMLALAELEQASRSQQQQQQQQQQHQQQTTVTQDSSASNAGAGDANTAGASTASNSDSPMAGSGRQADESSERLRQILERHVVMNKKITKKELDQLSYLQTMRATIKLADKPPTLAQQTTDINTDVDQDATNNQNRVAPNEMTQDSSHRLLCWESSSASIVKSNEAINGAVHIIDNVMVVDSDFQTSPLSSSSSLLSSSNAASMFYLKSISPMQNLILFSSSFVIMVIVCSLLVRHCIMLAKTANNKKISEDEEEDQSASGPLTSAHSNTTGSTSTTKSL